MQMPKRLLGSTGMEVSVMGFGASPLGGIFRVISCCRRMQCSPLKPFKTTYILW